MALAVGLAGVSLPGSRRPSLVQPVAAAYAIQGGLSRFVGDLPPAGQAERAGAAVAAYPGLPLQGTLTFGDHAEVTPSTSAGTVTGSRVNLRQGPGTAFAVIGKLRRGTRLEVVGQHDGWYQVIMAPERTGWLSVDYLKLDDSPAVAPSVSSPETTNELGVADTEATEETPTNDAVSIARQYIGAPYRWGGDDPDGFDCSGLTLYVYAQLGISLPHKASLQFEPSYGSRIDGMDQLAPGDLVFFVRTTRARGITHVGIYAGNGMMVTANTRRTGVQEVSVYEPYWSSRFAGGIRPYR